MASLYFINSSFTLGSNNETPIKLGIAIAKIIASEKSVTAPRLIEAPKTVNKQKTILYAITFLSDIPKRNNQD